MKSYYVTIQKEDKQNILLVEAKNEKAAWSKSVGLGVVIDIQTPNKFHLSIVNKLTEQGIEQGNCTLDRAIEILAGNPAKIGYLENNYQLIYNDLIEVI